METYKSEEQLIKCNIRTVFEKLSNPSIFKSHIEANLDRLPEEARENLDKVNFESDGITIESPMGPLKLGVLESTEPTRIVYGAAMSPVPFNLIINLEQLDEDSTRSSAEIQLDIPAMLRPMVAGPLKDGAKRFGIMLAQLPYDSL